MTGGPPSPQTRLRLNPFAFPSDTTLRFLLLVIFVVCGSGALWGQLRGTTDASAAVCATELWAQLQDLDVVGAGTDGTAFKELSSTIAECVAMLRPRAHWRIGGMALAVVVAAVLYQQFPSWILSVRRLQPLMTARLDDLDTDLAELVARSGVTSPTFVWNPLASTQPVVFGHHGTYQIALSGAFIANQFYNDRDAFRAVILHELAHIANRDIRKTYLTLSLLGSFLMTALLPSLGVSAWWALHGEWFEAVRLLVIAALWTCVTILSGLSVLRAREYYADVRASVWQRARDVERALAALPTGAAGWRRYLQSHPVPQDRLDIVRDPSRLFRLSFGDAFGLGVAAWLIIDVATSLALSFSPLETQAQSFRLLVLRFTLVACVLAVAIGAVGIGVWRNAFAALASGRPLPRRDAWLAVALIAGTLPVLLLLAADGLFIGGSISVLMLEVAINLVLLLACFLTFRWIADAASAWFEIVAQRRSPGPQLVACIVTALVLILLTLAAASFVVYLAFLIGWSGRGLDSIISLAGLTVGVPIFVLSMIAWIFPLMATQVGHQNRQTTVASWLYLDGATPALPALDPLRPQVAMMTGTVIGLIFWLLWELVYFRTVFPAAITHWIEQAFAAFSTVFLQIVGDEGGMMWGTATLYQALSAALAASCIGRLSVVHGLLAASWTGCVIVIGNLLFFGVGPGFDPYALTNTALVMLGLGASLALPTAILASRVGSLTRRALPVAAPPSMPRLRVLGNGLVVALALLVTLGLAARVREQIINA